MAASEFHQAIRRDDESAREKINYLMINDDMALDPFPSQRQIVREHNKIMENLSPDEIQAKFEEMCNQKPEVCHKMTGDLLNSSMLPGDCTLIDHIETQLINQSPTSAGGNYQFIISNDIESLKTKNDSAPATEIVFHESNTKEVKELLKSFNEVMSSQQRVKQGDKRMPSSFYSFDINFIDLDGEAEATVYTTWKDGTKINKYFNGDLPARICMTIHNKRWDIVIPWTKKNENEFVLKIAGFTQGCWITLFSKLEGLAVGCGIKNSISKLNEFLSSNYKSMNGDMTVNVKHVDIKTILYIVGLNNVPTNLSSLIYFFTGGFFLNSYELTYGANHWQGKLPSGYDCYLQCKGQTISTIVHICEIYFLMHLFPTIGIGMFVTDKEPARFLKWFDRFMFSVFNGASITCPKGSRSADPLATIRTLTYENVSPVFDANFLCEAIPQWRGLTAGGCLSDIQAISHLVRTMHSKMSNRDMHSLLRWSSDPDFLSDTIGPLHTKDHVMSSELFDKLGVNSDPVAYTLDSHYEFQTDNDPKEYEHIKSLLPKALEDLHMHEIVDGKSPRQALQLLIWNHLALAGVIWDETRGKELFGPELEILLKNYIEGLTDLKIGETKKMLAYQKSRVEKGQISAIKWANSVLNDASTGSAKRRVAKNCLRVYCKRLKIDKKDAEMFLINNFKSKAGTGEMSGQDKMDDQMDVLDSSEDDDVLLLDNTESFN